MYWLAGSNNVSLKKPPAIDEADQKRFEKWMQTKGWIYSRVVPRKKSVKRCYVWKRIVACQSTIRRRILPNSLDHHFFILSNKGPSERRFSPVTKSFI